jgi:hypothetical protein
MRRISETLQVGIMSSEEDLAISLAAGMSGKQRERLKQLLALSGRDIFAATNQVKLLKNEWRSVPKWEWTGAGAYVCINISEVLADRLSTMALNS